ncbi:MAG: peptidoglycan-binding domain-containing protein [Candidatus Omnitrophica bacterium]|jgi:murein L,D-transpeptidase YcbB/YkuD|nr:peptidoglycan-binding protein [Candidatus Omnitrophota bacterium]MDD3274967.1 peptidoglycan-binding domain-containing protein [Candidatus Omnitrophota bacterium]
MERKWLWLGVAGVFMLSGCATVNKKNDLQNQELRNKIMVLEAQLSEKDSEINSLKESAAKSEMETTSVVEEKSATKQVYDAKQVQTALKNAGYFEGKIDGKIGSKTRSAIKAFQKANGLKVDGKIGKNTWAVLKGYLDKKVK